MKDISVEQILNGIVNNNSFIIQKVYKKFFVIVRKYIQNHGGREADAKDVFQDGIMVIYEQHKNQQLKLKNEFGTYLFAICRNIWLNQKRAESKMVLKEYSSLTSELEKKGWNDLIKRSEEISFKESRARIYQSNFEKLSEECRKLLKLTADGLSVQEITLRFGYKSEGFTYKKRSICKGRLVKLINKDENLRKHENL
ncbi:MAG: sigma-70 family RNA polymerase sigma factor [Chlorobi bacterium]|nr:sigma-70 family RNA polymerase sigma factor [Chlorobiota bacterium]